MHECTQNEHTPPKHLKHRLNSPIHLPANMQGVPGLRRDARHRTARHCRRPRRQRPAAFPAAPRSPASRPPARSPPSGGAANVRTGLLTSAEGQGPSHPWQRLKAQVDRASCVNDSRSDHCLWQPREASFCRRRLGVSQDENFMGEGVAGGNRELHIAGWKGGRRSCLGRAQCAGSRRTCWWRARSCSVWRLTASTSSVTVATSLSVRHVRLASCASFSS